MFEKIRDTFYVDCFIKILFSQQGSLEIVVLCKHTHTYIYHIQNCFLLANLDLWELWMSEKSQNFISKSKTEISQIRLFSEALLNTLSVLYHRRLKAKHGWVSQTIPDSVYNNWSCAFHIRVPSERGGGGRDKLISEIVAFNNNQSLPAIKTMLACGLFK